MMFVVGQEYRRRDLHVKYGGQQQGGISTPSDHPYIFLFSSPRGEEHGYADGPKPNGQYTYTGEGQRGDMEFSRGNRAIRDHAKDRKSLYLFEETRRGYVRFYGEMAYHSHYEKIGPDTEGHQRNMIVFVLERVK
jgi:5-methylcytosine-specific restriction protein A